MGRITISKVQNKATSAVADPGFPIGGANPVGRGADVQCGHFVAKMYAKMKELGPVGGRGHAGGTP